MKEVVVVKIGGSLLKDASSYESVANQIKDYFNNNETLVVVSAMSGVTDAILSSLSREIKSLEYVESRYTEAASLLGGESLVKEVQEQLDNLRRTVMAFQKTKDKNVFDYALSFGEKISKRLMMTALENLELKTANINSTEIIIVSELFGSIDYNLTFNRTRDFILKCFNDSRMPIMEGFICGDLGGYTHTLGRGGSDYTATIVGTALDAKTVYLLTDTHGILSINGVFEVKPRVVEFMSFEEAYEASLYGVKKLHRKTFEPIIIFHPKTRVLVGMIENSKTCISWDIPENYVNTIKLIAYKNQANKHSKVALIGNRAKQLSLLENVTQLLRQLRIQVRELKFSADKPKLEFTINKDYLKELIYSLHESFIGGDKTG
ncbi:MAG: hypothetical protein JTT16_00925 [Candidatus Brockarchaeota archaeon]|nr:hypothetical protein [Candidatus Brockarchaeota archaeon]MBO3767871.1 hypothetical protein [Candidatus Brockarchaeota archaeon]